MKRALVYADRPWVEVYTDTVELPDGRVRERFHHVALPEFSIVVPVTSDGRFVMVREYKPGPASLCLNAPAGGIDAGESPLDTARRELREETGYAADDWRALGAFVVDGSTGAGRAHVFLARGATRVGPRQLDENEEIDVVLMDEAALRAALAAGEVVMLPTAAALGLALLALTR